MIAALINLIVWLLVLGILYWLAIYVINAIPIPDPPARIIKIALTVLICIVAVLVILNVFGLGGGLDMPKIAS